MKVELTTTVDGELQEEFTPLRDKNGEPFVLSAEEAIYWADRMLDINTDQGGNSDFCVRIKFNED